MNRKLLMCDFTIILFFLGVMPCCAQEAVSMSESEEKSHINRETPEKQEEGGGAQQQKTKLTTRLAEPDNSPLPDISWEDDSVFEGRKKVLPSYFDYVVKLRYFMSLFKHELRTSDIENLAKIAYEHKFTERELEEAVYEADEMRENESKEKITKEEMDLVFHGRMNEKLGIQIYDEQRKKSPEGKAEDLGKNARVATEVGVQVAEVVQVATNPTTSQPSKIREIVLITRDKIGYIGRRIGSWFKKADDEETDPYDKELQEKMPKQYCHLQPYLAGDQPREICRLMNRVIHHAENQGATCDYILLYGPPGTGKSEIAQALAKKLRASGVELEFLEKPGSGLMTEYQAGGSQAVKAIEKEIDGIIDDKKNVLLFVDEADAISGDRSKSTNQDVRSTLNQLLILLTKYQTDERLIENKVKVIVIFATNLDKEIDLALNRRVIKVEVPLPDEKKLYEIFRFHLSEHDKNYAEGKREETLKECARRAHKAKFSGSDVHKVVARALDEKKEKRTRTITRELVYEAIKEQAESKNSSNK